MTLERGGEAERGCGLHRRGRRWSIGHHNIGRRIDVRRNGAGRRRRDDALDFAVLAAHRAAALQRFREDLVHAAVGRHLDRRCGRATIDQRSDLDVVFLFLLGHCRGDLVRHLVDRALRARAEF